MHDDAPRVRWSVASVLLVAAFALGGAAGLFASAPFGAPVTDAGTGDADGGGDNLSRREADAPGARVIPVMGLAQLSGGGGGALPVVPLAVDADGYLVGEPEHRMDWYEGVSENAVPAWDVRAWFAYCGMDEFTGLAGAPVAPDALALRYAAPPQHAEDPWYANRTGERVHVTDIAEGEWARVTWMNGTDASRGVPLIVMRLNATDAALGARNVAHEGLIAFSASSTHMCAPVAPWPDAPHLLGEARSKRVRGHADDPFLVIDHIHAGAWDPRRIVRDAVIPGFASPGGPGGEAFEFTPAPAPGDAATCDPGVRYGWVGTEAFPLEDRQGQVVDAGLFLATRDVAFRNLTWRAFIAPVDAPSWDARVASFNVTGADAVAPRNVTTLHAAVPLSPDLAPGWYVAGVTWNGERLSCAGGGWTAFAPGGAASTTTTRLHVLPEREPDGRSPE